MTSFIEINLFITVIAIESGMGRGVRSVGHVAATGETLNVADVGCDERFNDNIDQQVGRSLSVSGSLSLPIIADWVQDQLHPVYADIYPGSHYRSYADGQQGWRGALLLRRGRGGLPAVLRLLRAGTALRQAVRQDPAVRGEAEGDPGGSRLPQQRHGARPDGAGADGEDLNSYQRQGSGSVGLVSPGQSLLSAFRFSYYGAELTDYGKIEKVVIMFNDLFGKERFEPSTLVRESL